MYQVFQEICKKERETYLENLIKESKSPLYKKCDSIHDFKKKEKCKKEVHTKVSKTPLGKKRQDSYRKVMDCMENEIKKKGCLEKKKKYEEDSTKVAKAYLKIVKNCKKIKNKEERDKCIGKTFNQFSKSSEAKKIDEELKKSTKEYSKCMSKK